MHGGTNPGGQIGNQNAFKHGLYSQDTIEARRKFRALQKEWRDFEKLI